MEFAILIYAEADFSGPIFSKDFNIVGVEHWYAKSILPWKSSV